MPVVPSRPFPQLAIAVLLLVAAFAGKAATSAHDPHHDRRPEHHHGHGHHQPRHPHRSDNRPLRSLADHGYGPSTQVTCSSTGHGYAQCPIAHGSVRLIRRHSSAPCHPGSDWGVGHGMVWVDNGCRATFAVH
ncbi:DUF3011 domain-containing protein [Stenotrophomonas forensis]